MMKPNFREILSGINCAQRGKRESREKNRYERTKFSYKIDCNIRLQAYNFTQYLFIRDEF